MEESKQLFNSYLQEVKDYKNLDSFYFLLKYDMDLEDNMNKDYELYKSDNEWEEILDKDEWIEEVYKEENWDELYEKYSTFFTHYGIDKYEWEYDNIYDICIAWWWPDINIRVEEKTETVIYKLNWASDKVIEDISYLYDTICDIYNLDF